jgi:hypothetical protein
MSPERVRRKAVRKIRLQSAMEYLMTYGWAILIIAVVLGVLFQMGVFNSSSLTVRMPPGACKVLRTSAATNLVGQCSGILPKYVAQFDGVSSYIGTGTTPSIVNGITIDVWVDPLQIGLQQDVMSRCAPSTSDDMEITSTNAVRFTLGLSTTIVNMNTGSFTLSAGNWYNIVDTFNVATGTAIIYVNGIQEATGSGSGAFTDTGVWTIGQLGTCGGGNSRLFDGQIADVQIYNTSLDASSVTTLYQEGIGGAPVDPSHIVGWWPINGDTKDYSGNNNNGVPTAITYTAQYGK